MLMERKKIESYEFGKIKIDGKTYTSDLLVFSDRVHENWWRKEGHTLCLDDLRLVLKNKPEVLIVGSGYNGLMKVPKEVVEKIEKLGIKLIIRPTSEAVSIFNELVKRKKAAAALHLTC